MVVVWFVVLQLYGKAHTVSKFVVDTKLQGAVKKLDNKAAVQRNRKKLEKCFDKSYLKVNNWGRPTV